MMTRCCADDKCGTGSRTQVEPTHSVMTKQVQSAQCAKIPKHSLTCNKPRSCLDSDRGQHFSGKILYFSAHCVLCWSIFLISSVVVGYFGGRERGTVPAIALIHCSEIYLKVEKDNPLHFHLLNPQVWW